MTLVLTCHVLFRHCTVVETDFVLILDVQVNLDIVTIRQYLIRETEVAIPTNFNKIKDKVIRIESCGEEQANVDNNALLY